MKKEGSEWCGVVQSVLLGVPLGEQYTRVLVCGEWRRHQENGEIAMNKQQGENANMNKKEMRDCIDGVALARRGSAGL